MSALQYSRRSWSPSSSSSSAESSTSSSSSRESSSSDSSSESSSSDSSTESSSSDSNLSSSSDSPSSRSPSPATDRTTPSNRRCWPTSNYRTSKDSSDAIERWPQDGSPNGSKWNCLDMPSPHGEHERVAFNSPPTIGSEALRKSVAADVDKELPRTPFVQRQRRSERIFLSETAPRREEPPTLQSRRSWNATREQIPERVTYGPAAVYYGGGYKYFRHYSSKVKGHTFLFRRATHTENDGAFKCTACLKVATNLDLNLHLVKSVRVMNGLIASDPETRHICLRSSNGTVQPRTSNGSAKSSSTPAYTKKDCIDEVYDPVTEAGRGVISYYSGMYSRRLEFRFLGESKHVPGVREYYCTACRKVDKNHDCIVIVKDGQFVAVDPDYSFNGHVCIKAEKMVDQRRAAPVTLKTSVKSTVAKQTLKRKSPTAATSTAKSTPNDRRQTRAAKLPAKQPGSVVPSGSKAQDYGKAHFNANGEVEWKSKVHKGKTLRFAFHAHDPARPVRNYRCDACHELCAKYKSVGAVPRVLPVRDDKLMRNPDECGTNFGHLCQMPKKVAELQARHATPQAKRSRLDSPALQDHEFSAGIDANVDDVAENFEDLLDNLDAILSPEAGAEGGQYENDEGAGVVNFIVTSSTGSASGPQNAAAMEKIGTESDAHAVPAAASEDRKPDISVLRQQQHRSSVANISLHPDDDDEIQFLGVKHPERRQSSQLPEIEVVGVTPGKPGGKQKATSARSAATMPPTPAGAAPDAPLPAATAVATEAGPSSAMDRSAAPDRTPQSRRSSTTGPPTASVVTSRPTAVCTSSGATAGAAGAAQVARDLNRIDDDEILLLDLENILEEQTPWTPRHVKQEVKQEAVALQPQQPQGMPPVMANKPPSGYVTNFGKAHFSPDGTLAFFKDILGLNYTFEQLETLRETAANGEQVETLIYQCKTCMEVASRLGMTVDFPRVKTVNGYFVDTDPGRPRGNAHLCTRNPNN